MPARFEDYRPYEMPGSLDELRGPSEGTVSLPLAVFWAPGEGIVSLDREGGVRVAYQAVISEGSAQDQCEILNKDVLIAAWPYLQLPVKAAKQWQAAFAELDGNPKAAWPIC